MIQVAIVTRRLKKGKTYDDFRKAWYHTKGFGTSNKMLTILNAANPNEIIVIGLTEAGLEKIPDLIAIDSNERGSNPLDEVIEPQIERIFGVLVAEDDFSGSGSIEYKPPTVNGKVTDMNVLKSNIQQGMKLLAKFRPDIKL